MYIIIIGNSMTSRAIWKNTHLKSYYYLLYTYHPISVKYVLIIPVSIYM